MSIVDTPGADASAPHVGRNAAVVREIYDAFGRGDVASILERLDDDVAWEAGARDTGIAYLRPRRGLAEVAAFFGDLLGNLELTHFEPEAICDGGDVVMATVRHAGRITGGGEVPLTQEAHEWRFGPAGRVISFRHLFDYAIHEQAHAARSEQHAGRTVRAVADVIEIERAGGQVEVFTVSGPRDSGPPPHAHPWDEIYLGIDGVVDVHLGDDVVALQPGELVAIPGCMLHGYRIASDSASFRLITSGHRASAFFVDLDANTDPGPPTEASLPAIVEVARRNGLTSPLFG